MRDEARYVIRRLGPFWRLTEIPSGRIWDYFLKETCISMRASLIRDRRFREMDQARIESDVQP